MAENPTKWSPPSDAVVNKQAWTPPEDATITNSNPVSEALNTAGQIANVMEPVPGIGAAASVGRGVIDLAKTGVSIATDMIPEQYAELQAKGVSARRKELEGIRDRGLVDMNTPGGLGAPSLAEDLQNQINAQPRIEQEIQSQKAEAQQKTKGVVQDFSDIHNASDLMSYIGQSIGQAAGQIPLSVATFGGSSFLMEAATVYDQQLDLLAEKHGISRDEVIKRGLDKPVEGELMAALAGTLDFASAATVLNVFKKAATKELTKNALKEFLKSSAWEGVTEGAQGVLEQQGAEQGAGVSKPIDWHSVANDAIAGAIGGSGLSMLDNNTTTKAANKTAEEEIITSTEQAIADESTGDPELDKSLDQTALEAATAIDKMVEKTDDLGSGAKLSQTIDEMLKENVTLTTQLEEAKRAQERAEAHLQLQQMQVIPKSKQPYLNGPAQTPLNLASEENELGPGVDEVSSLRAAELNPKTPSFTTTPEPEIPGAFNFHYTDEVGGRATGVIKNGMARLEEVYAAPEDAANPKDFQGRGFFGKVVNQLKKQGIHQLVVVRQSPGTVKALENLVKKGVIKNPREFIGQNNTLPTRFDITGIKPSEKQNDSENKQGVPSQVGTRKEPVVKQPKQRGRRQAPASSRVVQTPPSKQTKADNVKELTPTPVTKPKQTIEQIEAKVKEKKEKIESRLLDRLTTNAKSRSGRKLAAFKKVEEQATAAGLTELADKANKLWQTEYDRLEDKATAKEVTERKKAEKPTMTAEERKAEHEKKQEEKRKKDQARSVNKPTKVKKGITFAEDSDVAPRGATQNKFLAKAAQLHEKGDPRYRDVINEYIEYQKDNGLTAKTYDEVYKKISSERIIAQGEKLANKERDERKTKKAEAKRLSMPASKPLSAEEALKLKHGAVVNWKNPRTGELQQEVVTGIDPESVKKGTPMVNTAKSINGKTITGKLPINELYSVPTKEEITKFNAERAAEQLRLQAEKIEDITDEKVALIKAAGLNPEDFDISGAQEKNGGPRKKGFKGILANIAQAHKKLSPNTTPLDKTKLTQLTTAELASKLNNITPGHSLNKLTPLVLAEYEKKLHAQKKRLYIYTYKTTNNNNDYAFFLPGKNADLLFYNENDEGTIQNTTILHEIIHGHMSVLAQARFKTDTTFANTVNNLYDKTIIAITNAAIDHVNNMLRGRKNSEYTQNVMDAFFNYAETFYGKEDADKAERALLYTLFERSGIAPISQKDYNYSLVADGSERIKKTITYFAYGLSNAHELLAEGMANPAFARLLSSIDIGGPKQVVKKRTTVLSQLFNALRKSISGIAGGLSSLYKELGVKSDHLESQFNSAFDALDFIISEYSDLYDQEQYSELRDYADPNYHLGSLNWYMDTHGLTRGGAIEVRKEHAKEYLASPYTYLTPEYRTTETPDDTQHKPKKVNQKIINNIYKTLLKRTKEIKSQEDVQNYVDRVNKHLPTTKQLGDTYTRRIWNRIKKERGMEAQAIKLQKLCIDLLQRHKDWQTPHRKATVESWASVDIKKLTPEQRSIYIGGLMELVYNGVPNHVAQNLVITHGMKEQAKTALLPIAPKLHKEYLGNKKVGLEYVTNVTLFTSIISKFNSIVGDKLLKHIYHPLMQNMSHAIRTSTALTQRLNEIAAKNKLSHHDLAEIGMYGRIFATVANPTNKEEWRAEVAVNAEYVVKATEAKLASFENDTFNGRQSEQDIQKEIEVAKNLVKKIEKSGDMLNILSKGQTELYNEVRNFYSEIELDVARNAELWNQDYTPRYNYFPSRAMGNVKGENEKILKERADNLWDATTEETPIAETTIAAAKAKSKEERYNTENTYYEYDPTITVAHASKNILLDIHTTPEFKKLNRLMKDNEFYNAMGRKLIKSLTNQLKHAARSASKYENKIGWEFAKKFRDNTYSAAITTSPQFFLQAISGIADAAIITARMNPGKSLSNLKRALSASWQIIRGDNQAHNNKFYNFMVDNGLGLNIRDIFFERYFQPKDYHGRFETAIGKFSAKSQYYTESPMRWGDKYAAAAVFFAAYFDAGGTIENPNKDAIIHAERMVGVLQNTSDINFSAQIFRPDNGAGRSIMMMFYAFKSFALNAEISLMYSLQRSGQSAEARKIATSQLASVVAYRTLQGYIASGLYGAIAGALAGGDDDDDKEENRYSKWDEVMYNSLWDILMGGYAPGAVDGIFRYLFNAKVAPKIFEPEDGEEFDRYLDSPIYSQKDAQSALYKNMFGPGYSDALNIVLEGADLTAKWEDFEEMGDYDKAETQAQKLQWYAWMFVATMVGATPAVPLRGDIKRAIKKMVTTEKSKAFNQQKAGSFGTTEEDGALPVDEYILETTDPGMVNDN